MSFKYLRTERKSTYRYSSSCYLVALLILLTACDIISQPHTPSATPTSAAIHCTKPSSTPVTLMMYYGSEKQAWINDVVKDFNSRHISACDGPITVNAYPVGSGQSMQQIIAGSIKPDIWSPAGSVWLGLLNNMWGRKNGSDLVANNEIDSPPLLLSPVVLAMWKPQAIALGWPKIKWRDIYDLSKNPQGWGAYGHPEWGMFTFGHTRPDYSNSGLDAVIAENYAATKTSSGLTVQDVTSKNSKVVDFVGTVESSVIHYGDSTGLLANDMFTKGPSYLSAAVVYESLVVEANDGKTYPLVGKTYPGVVAIYPEEGTFYSDHPFAILQASWVNEAKRTSALAFRAFLLASEQQKKALEYGFRPADIKVPLAAPLDSKHGIDPLQPRTTLQLPSVDVVKEIIHTWSQLRRRVSVMLILDRSGSMKDSAGNESKIEAAKQGLEEFVLQFSYSDEVGLTVFSNDAQVLTPVTQLGPKRQDMLNQIKSIVAVGATRLYDTIAEQVRALQDLRTKNVKAVIVLTDGMDTSSQRTIDQLVTEIMPSSEKAGSGIKVFTIAYGSDADAGKLTRIAKTTGARECIGTPENIAKVYLEISDFFGVGDLAANGMAPLCS